jgi:hypothetical protein
VEKEIPDERAEVVLGEVGDCFQLLPCLIPAPAAPSQLQEVELPGYSNTSVPPEFLPERVLAVERESILKYPHARYVHEVRVRRGRQVSDALHCVVEAAKYEAYRLVRRPVRTPPVREINEIGDSR